MANAKPHVVAMVDYTEAQRLFRGARVLVDLPHGPRIPNASIRDLPKLTTTDLESGDRIPINIDVGDADLSSFVGTPVTVRFVQLPWTGLPLTEAVSEAVGAIDTGSTPPAQPKG